MNFGSNSGKRVGIAILVLLMVVGVFIWFNHGYSEISESGYDYALALISACGRQDKETVQRIAKEVIERELPNYDRRVILAITDKALAGQWKASSADTRALLKAQVRPTE
ncbi:MAG: hypothetical protein R3C53_00940 [Pirellulaceae bacterium]